MALKDRIFIIGVLCFILIGIWWNYYDEKTCDPIRKQIDEGFSKIESEGTIETIVIRNAPNSQFNVSFDSLVIDNYLVLDELRRLVLDLKWIELTRYPAKWTLAIQFQLRDNSQFEIWLNKTDAAGDGEYKVDKYCECEMSHTTGSKPLGDLVIRLIGEAQNASR